MRESAEMKGRRYICEGRLIVQRLDERRIIASCRGGGAVYGLGHDGTRWYCKCPARSRCSHLIALQLVTVREAP